MERCRIGGYSSISMNGLITLHRSIWPDGVKVSSKGDIYIGQSPPDLHMPLLGQLFVLDSQGKLLRTLTLPSPQVPNLAFSPDEKTIYVMALDQIDKSPYRGKVYSMPNE